MDVRQCRILTDRDVLVDIIKGIGICLVVLSHLTFSEQLQRIMI